MEKQNNDFLGTEPLGPLLRRLALPTVAAQLINMLYNAVSNAYLTQISYTEFKELMAEDKISEVSFKSDDRLIILTKEEAAKKSQ